MNYSSAGIGTVSHLTAEVLKDGAGIDIVHIPYKGGGPAMNDLIAGHVQLNMASIQVAKGFVESGKIKGLAVTSAKRAQTMPNLPTLLESGVKTADVDMGFWFGVFAPKGVPDAVKAKLDKAIAATMANPKVKERLAKLAIDPAYAPSAGSRSSSRTRSRIGASSSTTRASSRSDGRHQRTAANRRVGVA
jgi:tripartite-type tricarboxylate transporter receptor subunit TctC